MVKNMGGRGLGSTELGNKDNFTITDEGEFDVLG